MCAVSYFGYHLAAGERGIVAWIRLANELEIAQADLEVREAERRALELDVTLMRPDSLDPDMRDEQARAALGSIGEDEIVVFQTVPEGG